MRKVEVKPRFFAVAFGVMMRMIVGREDGVGDEESRAFMEMVEEVMTMIGVSTASDFFPAVARVVDWGGVRKRMRMVDIKKEEMLQRLINEKRRRRKEKGKTEKSMLEALLDLQEEEPENYSDQIIKAMIVVS